MWGKPPESSSEAVRPVEPLDGFAEAHQALRDDRAIQFIMEPAPRPQVPDLQFGGGGWDAAPALRVLFWSVLAVVAAFLIYLIVQRLTGLSFRRRRREEDAAEAWQPAEAPARALLAEADALAARGLYAEAARLLLHRSIDDIDERRPATVRPALTSRDIAGLPVLPASPAEAFARIVRAVERSLFGRRGLDAAGWQDCRAAYERFAFAPEWRG